ncbi:MAG: hypothetical protein KatS3mg060_0409 [Dehalococcoidia bacterium]|nr:MAG: hypothetical protein KatS3mg060_0409 [Dehalococcoidia bacterium]
MRLTIDTQQALDTIRGGLPIALVGLLFMAQFAPTPVMLATVVIALAVLGPRAWTSPRWLRAAVILGAALSVVSAPLLSVGGVNVRLSQAILPLALLALLTRTGGRLKAPRASLWALVTLLALGLFTLANPETRVRGLGQVMLFGLNLFHFVLAFALARETADGDDDSVRWLGWAALVMAGWSGTVLLADRAGIPLVASLVFEEGVIAFVDGQLVAQVVRRFAHAMIAAGVFAGLLPLFLALALDRRSPQWRFVVLAATASFLGLMFAFGRGPILGALAGLGVVVIVALRRSPVFTLRLLGIVAIVVAVGLGGLSRLPGGGEIVSVFVGRSVQLLDPTTYERGTANERLTIWGIMLDDLEGNWLVGKGALAYRPLLFERYYGGRTDNPPASENIVIEILHAGGLIAVGAYLLLHLDLGWGLLRRSLARTEPRSIRLRSQGFLGALVALFVASLFSPFAWNPMYWTILGVLAAAAVAQDRQRGAQLD